jgi:transcriptional regulator with XRE-family HTH domain
MVQLRRRLAKFIRERRGEVPQREFARKIGVAQSTIMRIENLDQNVTINTLETLCRVFRVDITELFPPYEISREYPLRPPAGLISPRISSDAQLVHEKKVERDSDQDRSEPEGKD